MSARLLRGLVTALILMIVLLPIYWMVAASLKSNLEITQQATLYPHAPSFDNYRRLFSEKQFGDYLTNSLVVTACSVALSLVIGTLAAYAIARFHLRFNLERTVGLSLLTLRIVPPVVILIPVYLLMLQLRLLDTWLGLIITYTALNITFCVWMMESFFARFRPISRKPPWSMATRASPPFAASPCRWPRPGLAATAIFAVIVTFNEFLFALVLTATPRAMTMPRGTATLIGRIDTDWASMAAAGVIGALPIVIFALLVQRHLVRGLTLGAVK